MTPSTRIPIAIVGLNFGRWIIDRLLKPGPGLEHFEVAAVCDLDEAKAKDMAAQIGARAFTSLDELLADPSIPAIGLFTGPFGRAELIQKIIRAGKDVMTTKPFELDETKALAVLDEARSLGRVVHLNSPNPVLPPDLLQIELWREKHNLGRPIGCRTEAYAPYNEVADGSWYDDPVRCPLAPVFRIGIYLINDLVQVFGRAESVQVFSSRIRTGRPTPDNAQLGIRFKNGAIANIFASLCVEDGQRWANSMTLNFENGTIYRNVGHLVFGAGPDGPSKLDLVGSHDGCPFVETAEFRDGSGEYQWEAFYRAIRGERIETSPEIVAQGIQIIAAMARAEKSGKTELA